MMPPRQSDSDRPMRFAYADPPYPGQSFRCYGDHPDYAGEVDHAELVAQLERDFPDGWALSTSAVALPEVLRLCPYRRGGDPKNPGRVRPEDSVRVLAWIKPSSAPRPVAVQFGWEPVVLRGGRGGDRHPYVWDWHIASRPGFRRRGDGGIIGAKPASFARWLFHCLGARPGDELIDLFPGSGAIGREWESFVRAPRLWEAPATLAQLELADSGGFGEKRRNMSP